MEVYKGYSGGGKIQYLTIRHNPSILKKTRISINSFSSLYLENSKLSAVSLLFH